MGGAAARNRAWNAGNREKYLAHKSVENAIKSGALKKCPCEVCGDTKIVHAHHDDYAKRFDVKWLCPLHHRKRHAELALGCTAPNLPELDRHSGVGHFLNSQTDTHYKPSVY